MKSRYSTAPAAAGSSAALVLEAVSDRSAGWASAGAAIIHDAIKIAPADDFVRRNVARDLSAIGRRMSVKPAPAPVKDIAVENLLKNRGLPVENASRQTYFCRLPPENSVVALC
jgi:hypothetical protein